jgi:uncharacterized alpha-E superfamily protein
VDGGPALGERPAVVPPTRSVELDPKCPRTVESCLVEASRWLLEIPRHEDAMAACAEIEAKLQSVDIEALVEQGLHEFADQLQLAVGELHGHIESTWFAPAQAAVAS